MKKIIFPHPYLIPLLLGLTVLLTRIPFRSLGLYDWDSVNFALGIADFNLTKHQPHPPGYILYIVVARFLNQIFKDSNTSMVSMSIISTIITATFVYFFSHQIYNRKFALMSSLLIITNPLLWYYDELALTYSIEVCASIVFAYACYRAVSGSEKWAYFGAVVLGISGGFRQTTLLILFPLAVFTAFRMRFRHVVVASVILGLSIVVWGTLLINWSGGLYNYVLETSRLAKTVEPEQINLLLRSLIYAGHIPLIFVIGYWFRLYPMTIGQQPSWEKWFLAFWIIPGLAIAALVHIGESGYILYIIPPLAIYSPALIHSALGHWESTIQQNGVVRRQEVQNKLYLTIFVLFIVNITTFLFGSLRLIQKIDSYWLNTSQYHIHYPPQHTLVLVRMQDFRHACYYLHQFQVYAFKVEHLNDAFLLSDQDVVEGWVYSCHAGQDNYDLNPTTHRLEYTIDIRGIERLLITNPFIISDIQNSLEEQSVEAYELEILSDRFTIIRLTAPFDELVIEKGNIELR